MTVGEPPPQAAPESPVYPYAPPPRFPEGSWAGHRLAGWWARVGAALLDSIFIVFLVAGAIAVAVVLAETASSLASVPFFIAAAVIWLCYAPFLMARDGAGNGQTWGKQLVGIRVVREDLAPMSFGWSLLREFALKTLLFGWIGGSVVVGWLLDVLWPLWDDENRALHDMLATTRVVET